MGAGQFTKLSLSSLTCVIILLLTVFAFNNFQFHFCFFSEFMNEHHVGQFICLVASKAGASFPAPQMCLYGHMMCFVIKSNSGYMYFLRSYM